jgi:hypothetical protein
MPRRSETSNTVLATWGKVELETLDNDSVRLLAEGKSPKKGLLIDFIGNFTRSAQEGLPIYRILGGAGFVWVASFDQKGRGALRFAAVDASASQPGLVATQPQNASQDDDQQPSQIQSELASAIRGKRDAEATVARLQTELSTALEAKVEAELAAQKARTYAEIARNELALAIDDANAAKEEVDTFKASDGTFASYVVNIIIISTSATALLLLIVWTIFRMLGASPRPAEGAGTVDTGLSVRKEPRLPAASTSSTKAQPSIDQYLVNQLARALAVHDLTSGRGKASLDANCDQGTIELQEPTPENMSGEGDSIPSKQLSESSMLLFWPREDNREELPSIVGKIPHGGEVEETDCTRGEFHAPRRHLEDVRSAASPRFPVIAVIHSFMVHGADSVGHLRSSTSAPIAARAVPRVLTRSERAGPLPPTLHAIADEVIE